MPKRLAITAAESDNRPKRFKMVLSVSEASELPQSTPFDLSELPSTQALLTNLLPLIQHWNCLDNFERSPSFHDIERKQMLRDLLENSPLSDKRESVNSAPELLQNFSKLTRAEQQAFSTLAQTCLNEKRRIHKEDVRSIVELAPSLPLFVDPLHGNDDRRGNGTERRPLASVDRAQEVLKDMGTSQIPSDTVLVCFQCSSVAPSCEILECAEATCDEKLCRYHFDGLGRHQDGSGDEIEFNVSVCMIDKCRNIYCRRHESALERCDVCTNASNAEVSLGCIDSPASFPLCKEHAVTCHKAILSPDFDIEGEPEEHEVLQECGFVCCPECVIDHDCGDDPTEYC